MKHFVLLITAMALTIGIACGQNTNTQHFSAASSAERVSPVMEVDPLRIEAHHVYPQRTSTHTITLSNSGDETLDWELTIQTDPPTEHTSHTIGSLPCTDNLYLEGCNNGDGLIYWDLAEVTRNIPCNNGSGYHDYTQAVHSLYNGEMMLTVQAGHDSTWFDVWIDWNNDLELTADELVLDDAYCENGNRYYNFPVEIAGTSSVSDTYVLRYRTRRYQPVTDACETYSYGNCCDFSAQVLPGQPQPWIWADNTTGSLAPGESQEITFSLNSEYLDFGYHGASLIFTGNDPNQTQREVRVDLWVSGFNPCPSPTNLLVYYTGEWLNFSWTPPVVPTGNTLRWDSGSNDDGIGLTNGGTMRVAARFEPDQLADAVGTYLTRMEIFPLTDMDAQFTLKIWSGEDAGEELLSQEVEVVSEQWNSFALKTLVFVEEGMTLWCGYEVTHQPGDFPAGVDAGPGVTGFGDMVSFDSGAWQSLYDATGGMIDINWNIAVKYWMLDGNRDAEGTLNPASPSHPNILVEGGNHDDVKNSAALLGYNIYEIHEGDTTRLNNELIDDLSWGAPAGASLEDLYFVCAVFDECESCSETASVITGIGESDHNRITMRPNPASDFVELIAGEEMHSVELLDLSGRRLQQWSGAADQIRINTTRLAPGIYVLQIETESGTGMRKLVIR